MNHSGLRERDAAARERAQSDFRTPIVLEAGAGTGKTATLVARVLAWTLGPGWEKHAHDAANADDEVAVRVLERITAITFTEAAAAEMAERIALGLASVAGGDRPVGLHAAALPAPELCAPRARALLGQIDRLIVRTIHAYCRRLLAAFPIEAGVHPSFEVDADGSRTAQVVRELLEARLREAYAHPGDPRFLELAAHGCGPGALEDLLLRALAAGLPAEALDRDPLGPEWIAGFLSEGAGALQALHTAAAGRLSAVSRRSPRTFAADAELDLLAAQLDRAPATREGLDALADWLRDELGAVLADKLAEWSRGTFNKSEAEALGEAVDVLPAAASGLGGWLDQASELRPLRLEAARRVVGPLLRELHAELQARGIATFESLLRDARRLVLEHPALRARIQADTEQLLVDEFQDTDAVQCDLVRALGLDGEPGRRPGLFVVGDPKQSIYGWRQADLAAYEQFVADLRAAGGALEHLHLNFRSRPAVLSEVHQLIAPVMLEVPGLQPGYQELLPHRDSAPGTGVEHWVSWQADPDGGGFVRPRASEAAALEARAVAADLRERHRGGVAWQEMAILMRSRGDLEIYLEALRGAGVPFDVEGDRSYYKRREIIDAGALVRCVVDPNDHLSLVTWLRSPAVGLPDAALVPLWLRELPQRVTGLRGRDAPALAELRAVLHEVAAALPADLPGLERIAGWEHGVVAGLEVLAALRESFEGDPPDVFVERLRTWSLLEAGEAARYLGRYRVANLERFLRRLTDDLCGTAGDAAALLSALRRRVREAEDEEEARPKDASDDAVQVRTIHQAKGLDWDHVYLVQAHKKSPNLEDQRLCGKLDGVWEYRLFDAPTPGHPRVLARFRAIARAEQVRTLYVALTRARERLVVAANWLTSPPRAPLEANSHEELMRRREDGVPDLATLWQAEGEAAPEGSPRWRFPAREPAAPAAATREHPLAEWLRSPAAIEDDARQLAQLREAALQHMVRPYRGGASSEELDAHRTRRAGTAGPGRSVAAAVGSAIHQLLEHFDPAAEPEAQRTRQLEQLGELLEPLVEPADFDAARKRGRELLERLHEGPLLERLRALGPDVARELPLLAAPGTGAHGPAGCWAGVIDLLYRDPESGDWVVADYKTDRARSDLEIRELLARYAPQGAVYTAAVQRALGLPKAPRFELWLVDAGRVEPVAPVQSPAR